MTLDKHTPKAMEELYALALQHQANYLCYTNWQIILKKTNQAIGSACFMGEPNIKGEVEIGYGITALRQHQGFMSEAAMALLERTLAPTRSNVDNS